MNLKNVGKGWNSNPYLSFQNHVALPTVPSEQLEILTNVCDIIKISDTTKIRTRTYRFRTLLSYPLCHRISWKSPQMSVISEKFLARQRFEPGPIA